MKCDICGEEIVTKDYLGEKVNEDQDFHLIIWAECPDESVLPETLTIHSKCLPNLREKLLELNEGERWE